ncbi:tetratricopeptide repeat protein [Streptomyces sp. NPDC046197]|uniref:tetratricopeptide repeat protein n=1 Tax=Streptomyces sp. NPDC046197 TaxID=3154337 RepID=UPI0033DE36FF
MHILYGLSGCGKTEIAWEVGQAARASGVHVWWVHAGGQASIGGGMREVAAQLGAPQPRVDEAWAGRASATDLVWEMLNDAPAPWLLVLDNADWPEFLADTDRQVSDGVGWLRLPRTPRGMVVVTSRVGERSVWGAWPARHRIGPLDPADGASILLDYAGRGDGASPEEVADASELSRRLGGLPVALQAAGAYLQKVNHGPVFRGSQAIRSIRDYHDVLVHRFDEGRPYVNQRRLTEELGLAAVHSTCEMSLSLLDERGQSDARPLLVVLAFMAARPIPYGAVLNRELMSRSSLFGEISESRIRLLVDALDGLTLISRGRNPSAGPVYGYTLTLHPLVRDVVLEKQGGQDALQLRRMMIDLLDDTVRDLDPDDPDAWTGWSALAPHCAGPVLDFVRWCEKQGMPEDPLVSAAFGVIRKVSRYLLARSLPRQAQLFLEDCLAALPRAWRTRGEVVALRHEYGRCLLEQGRLTEAAQELTWVLDQRNRNRELGGDHPDTMATRHKLARCMLEQRQWKRAEANLREILAYERRRNPDDPDTLTVWHSLVRSVVGQGHLRLDEAAEEIGAVLEAWRRRPHPHPENLFARITAAKIMLLRGEPEGALLEITDLLKEYDSKHWSARAEVAQARRLRGQSLCAVGRIEEGVWELQEVLSWQEVNMGPEHAETVLTRGILAEWS